MAKADTRPEIILHLNRTFKAPREKVYRAWTTPEELKRWFAPSDEFSIPIAELDVRVGGKYRIGMKPPEGDTFCVGGIYREVQPPEKLVFTWSWEGAAAVAGEMLVTVEFRDRGNSTEIALTHELFPDEKAREEHSRGWSGCLSRLAKVLERLSSHE